MKKFIAVSLSFVVLFSSLCSGIVSFADDANRVYLGTNTCYNSPYEATIYQQEYIDDGYNYRIVPVVFTAYDTVTYTFIAPEEALYRINGLGFPEDDNQCVGGIIASVSDAVSPANYDDVYTYCHLKKGESVSFYQNYNKEYSSYYSENEVYYGSVQSYKVTIEIVTKPTHIKNYHKDYIVNPIDKTAILHLSYTYNVDESFLGYPVTEIDEYAFYNRSNLETITIPKSVTRINPYAFTNCYKLKKVIIENKDCLYTKNSFFACREDLQIIGGTNKSISLAKASVSGVKKKTYTGKTITQNPTVKLSGRTLVKDKDYTLSYKYNKDVGTATVTIKGKGFYSGSITKKFKINPKGTSIKKVSGKSNAIWVKWNKQSAKTSGYQIKYSPDKSFKKNNKTITVSGAKNTSKTIKKLKKNKKYYVKVRTYKNVKGTKYYSSWSAVKTVKTK